MSEQREYVCGGSGIRPDPDGTCRYCGKSVETFTLPSGEVRQVEHTYWTNEVAS